MGEVDNIFSHPALWVIACIFGMIVATCLWAIIKEVWNDWFGLPGYSLTQNSHNYSTLGSSGPPKPDNTVFVPPAQKPPSRTYLLVGERGSPPKAAFFSRMGDETTSGEGDPEEKYLNPFELQYWCEQNKRARDLLAESVAKKAEAGILVDIIEQKAEVIVDLVQKGSKNG